jgi:hypothetical protein
LYDIVDVGHVHLVLTLDERVDDALAVIAETVQGDMHLIHMLVLLDLCLRPVTTVQEPSTSADLARANVFESVP